MAFGGYLCFIRCEVQWRHEARKASTLHTLTLELPDEIYVPLLDRARRSSSTLEALLTQLAASAVQTALEDPLLKLLGSVASDVTDISSRHDEYLGHSLQAETHK